MRPFGVHKAWLGHIHRAQMGTPLHSRVGSWFAADAVVVEEGCILEVLCSSESRPQRWVLG